MDILTVATSPRGITALLGKFGFAPVELGNRDADCIWKRSDMADGKLAEYLPLMPRVKWVHADTAGIDGLPLDVLRKAGVQLTKTSAYTSAVSEWAVALVLAAAKGLPAYFQASHDKGWWPGIGAPRLVAETNALIVGRGRIGSDISYHLSVLGVNVHATGRSGPLWTDLHRTADWLILACPLTAETRHMVTARHLHEMRAGAWLINLGRGELLAPGALAEAITSGHLGGAVTDSDDGPDYWPLDKVVVLPHDTWRAAGAGRRQVHDFITQAGRYKRGRPLWGLADLDAGY